MSLPLQCTLCKSGSEKQVVVTPHVYGIQRTGHAFFHCTDCDVYYQYPGLTPAEEVHFYAAEFEGFMQGRSGIGGGWQGAEKHIAANEETRVRRMKYLEPYLTSKTIILEVGCSSGFMLLPLKEKGHTCIGIEPSGVFGEFVRQQDIPVYDSLEDLIAAAPQQKFDIIQHFFVLEHIANPQSFIETQLALLNPGGKIIFEIPNVADPLYTVYDIPAFERFYWSVAHPWYFSEKSLTYLLDKIGKPYEILLDQRYDLSNHMTWARDGKPGGMKRFTEKLGTEMEEMYKKMLIKKGICDTLIAVITKN